MTITFILLLIALLCFLARAFGVNSSRVDLVALGLALVTLSMLLPAR
jgi:hypothetical protein